MGIYYEDGSGRGPASSPRRVAAAAAWATIQPEVVCEGPDAALNGHPPVRGARKDEARSRVQLAAMVMLAWGGVARRAGCAATVAGDRRHDRTGGENREIGGEARGENLRERYRVLTLVGEGQQDATTPSRRHFSRRGAPYAYSRDSASPGWAAKHHPFAIGGNSRQPSPTAGNRGEGVATRSRSAPDTGSH
jgi:hypothetical protein